MQKDNYKKQFDAGEYVVYGSTGVCLVQAIIEPSSAEAKSYFDKNKSYYVLKPVYQSETIYIPTDNDKVFMRNVISKQEAERLIDRIPYVEAEVYHAENLQDLRNYYKSITEHYDCEDLIELTISIYNKKQKAEENKKKFGEVDGKYMKQAEDMLYGEFAIALNIDKKEVPQYISKRVEERLRLSE